MSNLRIKLEKYCTSVAKPNALTISENINTACEQQYLNFHMRFPFTKLTKDFTSRKVT